MLYPLLAFALFFLAYAVYFFFRKRKVIGILFVFLGVFTAAFFVITAYISCANDYQACDSFLKSVFHANQ